MERPPKSNTGGLVGAAVMPFAVVTLYLCFSRWPTEWSTAGTTYAALATAIAAGGVYLVRSQLPVFARVLLCVPYAVVVGVLLVGYALLFECEVSGDCL